jgi:hypothetical protein
VATAIGSYAGLRYILKCMLSPARLVLLAAVLLAGCATSRAGDGRVSFPNATRRVARERPATI